METNYYCFYYKMCFKGHCGSEYIRATKSEIGWLWKSNPLLFLWKVLLNSIFKVFVNYFCENKLKKAILENFSILFSFPYAVYESFSFPNHSKIINSLYSYWL